MYLTRQQSRDIDRRSLEEFHIPGIVLMENASRAVADAASEELIALTTRPTGTILIFCGPGNNGGDGLAAARHLHNRGNVVSIALAADPVKYQGDALINWRIVQAMRLPILDAAPAAIERFKADLLIDALFGTGLTRPPREPFPALVAAIASTGIPVLSIDLPSGLDCDTGEPLGPTVRAMRTVTFCAEKAGFANPSSRRFTGRVTVGDIGCPRELIDERA